MKKTLSGGKSKSNEEIENIAVKIIERNQFNYLISQFVLQTAIK